MPTIKVTRAWEVTIPQKDLDAIKEKGLSDSDLYWTCTEYANSGEFGTLYCVEYVNRETKARTTAWGTYNDVMIGDEGEDLNILYELANWNAKEQAWNAE